ncbi:MAG: alpha/beta fold hydrolase [Acidobacteria bacterium]|jgi:uncharacterized protein|nr:alpha/beta fold hydrolase [Acidobacteriota bacterium]
MGWLAIPAVVVVLMAFGTVAVSRHYRVPQVPHRRTPESLGIGFEEIRFPTAANRTLYGWWIPAAAAAENSAPTLVLVHGWSRNVERVLPFIRVLQSAGYRLLAFDARGHGSSDADSSPNMLKFSQDIRAAIDEAERRGADPSRLGVLGLSVGGAASIHAAANDRRIGAVVTVGAFANPRDLMRGELQAKGLPAFLIPAVLAYAEHAIGERLDVIAPENQIPRISAPVLLVHGLDDAIIPAENGRRLAAAGGREVRLLELPGRGHSNCNYDPLFWPEVTRHLESALGGGAEAID